MTNKLSPTPEPGGVSQSQLGTCADFPTTPHPKGTCENCDMWTPSVPSGGVSQSVDYEAEVKKVYLKAEMGRSGAIYLDGACLPNDRIGDDWEDAYSYLGVPSPEPKVEPAKTLSRGPNDGIETLVHQFSRALREKLYQSEAKYGWNNGWMKTDWEDDLRRDIRKHVEKGDPRDVAAYCAFAWHHGWSLTIPVVNPSPVKVGEPQKPYIPERWGWLYSESVGADLAGVRIGREVSPAAIRKLIEELGIAEAAWNAAMAAKSGTATEHKIYWSESTVGCSCGWKFEFGDKGVDYGQEKYDAHVKSGTGDGVGTNPTLMQEVEKHRKELIAENQELRRDRDKWKTLAEDYQDEARSDARYVDLREGFER